MTFAAWLSLASVCLLGATSPGPSLAVVLRHSVAHSLPHGLIASTTHAFAIGLYALAAVSGIALLMQSAPVVFDGMRYAGAAYLVWMGIKILRSSGSAFAVQSDAATLPSKWSAAREGFLVAFLNPKIALFFAALFSQFVAPHQPIHTQLLLVGTVFSIDLLWYLFVSVLVTRGPLLRVLNRHQRTLNNLMGGLLILVALRIALQF